MCGPQMVAYIPAPTEGRMCRAGGPTWPGVPGGFRGRRSGGVRTISQPAVWGPHLDKKGLKAAFSPSSAAGGTARSPRVWEPLGAWNSGG